MSALARIIVLPIVLLAVLIGGNAGSANVGNFTKEYCKSRASDDSPGNGKGPHDGWIALGFRNQGQCVSAANHAASAAPSGTASATPTITPTSTPTLTPT